MLTDSNNMNNAIFVQKRDGSQQEVSFDKVLKRMKNLAVGLDINPHLIAQKLCNRIYDGVKTSELDILGAEICALMITTHPDYQILAGRISQSNLTKNTSPSFSETIQILYDNQDRNGERCSLISEELYQTVQKHKTKLNSVIKHKRDENIGYFGLMTLQKSYLFKVNGKIVERPQYMFMRVALGIHGNNIKEAIETYHGLSEQEFIHATPTLFNAGTKRPQLSSCFLLSMKSDSIEGIFSTLKDCALISKWAGGIGLHMHNVRAKNSMIRGTNGISNGLVPMLRVFNNTARYVDQCITPNTIIYTTQGPMKIKNVTLGETEIYNLQGQVEVIENVLEHPYHGELLQIETIHSMRPLYISPEHPVYVLSGQEKQDSFSIIEKRLQNRIVELEWKEAGQLLDNDMIAYPIPKYSKDISSITVDDCYVYGVILGVGNLPNDSEYGNLVLPKNNRKLLHFVENYFGSKLAVINSESIGNEKTKISWSKSLNMPFRYGDIYQNEGEKYVHHRWLNLPVEKMKFILKGLLDSKGFLGSEITFDSQSYHLIECIRFMCLKMGILTSGFTRDRVGSLHLTEEGKEVMNRKICYTLRIPKTEALCELLDIDYNSSFFEFFRYGDVLLTRIKNIYLSKYQGTLYDLQMKKEHNYLIHNGLVHNGGGKRNGSIAAYLEPWHADVFDFLVLKKNHGNEEERARDLFYALWTPDLFMERVKQGGDWTLMCPDECPGLSEVYGDDFKELYEKYEREGRGKRTIKAQELWSQILESQIETGTPYLLFKDASNKKSNQKNLGTIKSSNLCCEIVEYSSPEETAVCNLASIGLPKFVKEKDGEVIYDYDQLDKIVKIVTRNLNKVIDINFYPIPETRTSNLRHRPIGIGVQGLADVFAMMKVGFDTPEAAQINRLIFEHIYLASLEASMDISKKREKLMKKYKELTQKTGEELTEEVVSEKQKLEDELKPIREELNRSKYLGSYSSYEGSPISEGIFQFDMWGVEVSEELKPRWDKLRKDIKKYGIRNSLLVAPMPTASTSQIMGNNECIEPYTTNIYIRRVLAGEFIVLNDHLVRDLIKLDMWNPEIKDQILYHEGSIQQIDGIPEDIKKVYKTVWEMSQKNIINMASDRGAFICQSQSMNLFIARPDFGKLTSMHFYSWKQGLKTGIYYLRSKPIAKAQQFTIDPEMAKKQTEAKTDENGSQRQLEKSAIKACRLDNPDCLTCGS